MSPLSLGPLLSACRNLSKLLISLRVENGLWSWTNSSFVVAKSSTNYLVDVNRMLPHGFLIIRGSSELS